VKLQRPAAAPLTRIPAGGIVPNESHQPGPGREPQPQPGGQRVTSREDERPVTRAAMRSHSPKKSKWGAYRRPRTRREPGRGRRPVSVRCRRIPGCLHRGRSRRDHAPPSRHNFQTREKKHLLLLQLPLQLLLQDCPGEVWAGREDSWGGLADDCGALEPLQDFGDLGVDQRGGEVPMPALPVDGFGQVGLHDIDHADLPVLVLERAKRDAIEA
jgi:hypothetical protein